jgi:ATP:ADP antiporter, AAA family
MVDMRASVPFESAPAVEPARPTLLERALGVVTEVRPGEGVTALLLATALFLLLMAYYIIKPVREALILQHPAGAEYKSWLGAAIAGLLLIVVPAYSKLADRLPRNRLVTAVTVFFASHLVFFYFASTSGMKGSLWLSLVFFVWVGIFNMMLVAQLWAFANDVYDQERGKRLFTIVGLGASVGAIAGGAVKTLLASVFDVFQMLLVSAAALVGVAVITQVVHRRESRRAASELAAAGQAPPEPSGQSNPRSPAPAEEHDRSGAFAIVFRHRYLTLIAAFSLVFTFVNTNGEYILGKLIKAAATDAVARGTVGPGGLVSYIDGRYNVFFTWVNILCFVLQFLVVSRLIRRAGFGPAFLILPVIALLDGAAVAVAPVLAVLFIGKIAENSTDYSLNNTLRQMLWLPTTRDMKYKAKQAVDTFFVRMGDVASGAWVVVGAGVLQLGVRGFALTNTVLVIAWLWLAWAIIKLQRQLAAQAEATGG